jgi:hypothetical protein
MITSISPEGILAMAEDHFDDELESLKAFSSGNLMNCGSRQANIFNPNWTIWRNAPYFACAGSHTAGRAIEGRATRR